MSHPYLPYGGRKHTPSVPDADALVLDHVTVGYPGSPTPAIEDVCLSVRRGTRVALVGHNGAGKSSLLKAVAGLLPIQSGAVRIFGHPSGACYHRVAYLPQRGEVDWRFPVCVERFVLTGRYAHLGWLKRPRAQDRQIVRDVMDRLGLMTLAQRQIGKLSGGQQQRALVARALAQRSDMLLLDEPLNAVDADTRVVVGAVLADLHRQGKTIVIATHDLARLEADFDMTVFLNRGRSATGPSADAARGHVLEGRAWAG
jgi:manganese/zinc/iron transport system ATP- binding protein